MPNFRVYLVFFAIIICAVAGFFGFKEYKAVSTVRGINAAYADADFQPGSIQSIHIVLDKNMMTVNRKLRKNTFDVQTVNGIKVELLCVHSMKNLALQYGDQLNQIMRIPYSYTITYHFKSGAEKEFSHKTPPIQDANFSHLMKTDEVKKQIGG